MTDRTIASIRQCAAGINTFDLLAATTQLFAEKSMVLQASIALPANKGVDNFKHLKISHELGALFEAIMVQLTGLNPAITSYRTGPLRGAFIRDPQPAALPWNNEDSYEQRLAKALLTNNYKKTSWSKLDDLLRSIITGVEQVILNAKATGKLGRPGGPLGLVAAPAAAAAPSSVASSAASSAASADAAARAILEARRAAGRAAGSAASSSANLDLAEFYAGVAGKGLASEAAAAPEPVVAAAAAPEPVVAAAAAPEPVVAAAAAPEPVVAAAVAPVYAVNARVEIISMNGRKGVVTSINPDGTYMVKVDGQAAPSLRAAADIRQAQNGGTRRRRRNGKGKRGSRRN